MAQKPQLPITFNPMGSAEALLGFHFKQREAFQKRLPLLLLLAFAALLWFHHRLGWLGPFGYDDLQYGLHAKALLKGHWDWTDQFAHRLAVIVPTALCIAVFGSGDLAMSLPALLASMALAWLLISWLRPYGLFGMAMGLLLVFGAKWMLFYSDKTMPDLWVALSFAGTLSIVRRQRFGKAFSPIRAALFFALWWVLGFFAKGTVLLLLPIFLGLFFSDLVQKRQPRFWLWVGIWLLLLGSLYLLAMAVITGNPFARFAALEANSYLNACSYDQQPIHFLHRRITIGWLEMAWQSVLLVSCLGLVPLLLGRWPSFWLSAKSEWGFWGLCAALGLASANFMSISYKAYVPLCLDPRHYLWLLPVLGMAGTQWMSVLLQSKKQLAWGILWLVLLLWWGGPENQLPWPYLWVLFFALVARIFLASWPSKLLFLGVVASFLWNQYAPDWHYARRIQFRTQQAWAKQVVADLPPGSTIVSNEVQARLFQYYGFPKGSHWYSYGAWDSLGRPSPEGYLLLNPYTRGLSGAYEKGLPWYARFPESIGREVAKNEPLNLSLWKLQAWTLPEKDGRLLFKAFQDFEEIRPSWSHNPLQIREEKAHGGQYAAWFTEFSSGFSLGLDSLHLDQQDFVVEARLWLLSEDSTKAQLVFSLDQGQEALAYESLALQPFLKTFGHWWPVRFQWAVPKTVFRNATLKAYVYNPDSLGVWIDDFEIKGYAIDLGM